jgi:hypothetical protein
MGAPEGATLSDDGYYWWDGAQWQPVDDSAQTTNTSYDGQQQQYGYAQESDQESEQECVDQFYEELSPEASEQLNAAAVSSGQVLFNPQPSSWSATDKGVTVEYGITNGTSNTIQQVTIHWTVTKNGKATTKDVLVTNALKAGGTAKGKLTFPGDPLGKTFVLQILFDGGQQGDHDSYGPVT